MLPRLCSQLGCEIWLPPDYDLQPGGTIHQLWEELRKFLGCKLIHTTAFHPESNGFGFIQRQHRTLKAAFKAQ